MAEPIVIVGASLGGLRAAEQLRAGGWEGRITVFGDEPYRPYNRPPLSKDFLTREADPEEALPTLLFRTRRGVDGIDWQLGTTVTRADLAGHTITTASGRLVPYSGLVAASGLRPARLQGPGPANGRFVLRTFDDAVALRAQLRPGRPVVVAGAGFVGCEVAASAAAMGCTVTLAEGSTGPLERALGSQAASGVRRMLRDHGIDCLPGRRVASFLEKGRLSGVRLDDGSEVAAEVVVEAIGSHPNVEWLTGNGLDLSDGIACDASMRILDADGRPVPHAVAVGDVARFPDRFCGGEPRRVEHWATPADTAKIAAGALTADLWGGPQRTLPPPLPSFWTDLFGTRIQGVGSPSLARKARILEGDPLHPEAGLAIAYLRSGRLVGAVTAGLPPQRLLALRQLILDQKNLVSA